MTDQQVRFGAFQVSTPLPMGRESNQRWVLHEEFRLGLSSDNDIWPEMVRISVNEDDPLDSRRDRTYTSCGGRFRMPFIGGGGSEKLFEALHRLMRVMARDTEWCAKGAQGFFRLNPPLYPRPYIERHMDDQRGYIGMEITAEGTVRLHMRPLQTGRAVFDKPVWIEMAADTPYQLTYDFMPRLYYAIAEDNRKLGAFRGNHA